MFTDKQINILKIIQYCCQIYSILKDNIVLQIEDNEKKFILK